MPDPSQVTATQINTELGVSASAQLKWGNNWARNVATQYTATDSPVNASKFRWGINLPGGSASDGGGGGVFAPRYELDDGLLISTFSFAAYNGVNEAGAFSTIIFRSNGQLSIITNGNIVHNRTWLTSGGPGDYTIQFSKTGGTHDLTYGTQNTDLILSADQSFELQTIVGPNPGYSNKSTSGNLILKEYPSGVTHITRPTTFQVEAEVSI